jgi:hypothetical protein
MLERTHSVFDRSGWRLDPLSDVLSLLKLRSYMSGGLDMGGDWSIQFAAYDGIKFQSVVSGECWLAVEGIREPARIRAGECFLLASGKPFRIAGNLAAEPIDAETLLPAVRGGRIVTYNGGGDFFSVGGNFTLADGSADYCEIQADGRDVAHGISDALANAGRGGQVD